MALRIYLLLQIYEEYFVFQNTLCAFEWLCENSKTHGRAMKVVKIRGYTLQILHEW